MGSQGGDGAGAPGTGGPGGAALLLNASGNVTLQGTIDMSGGGGRIPISPGGGSGGSGGGAGGTISIDCQGLYGQGSLNTNGGMACCMGSFYSGGGGGGGCIRICPLNGTGTFTGTTSALGAQGVFISIICPQCVGCPCFSSFGPAGSNGTVYTCASAPTPTPTPLPVNCEVLGVSQNLFTPSQGPVSLSVSECLYPGKVQLWVFNSAGEHIRTLLDQDLQGPFQASLSWDGNNKNGAPCASGLYLFILEGPFSRKCSKVLLVRH
jgi:hypothetical protein